MRVTPGAAAILLLGGDKTGSTRWYEENVRRADTLFDNHLRALSEEGEL